MIWGMTKTNRYFVMSVPDNNDGAFWFVYDRQTLRSVEFPSMAAADAHAATLNGR
jgi:hypothetical protein